MCGLPLFPPNRGHDHPADVPSDSKVKTAAESSTRTSKEAVTALAAGVQFSRVERVSPFLKGGGEPR